MSTTFRFSKGLFTFDRCSKKQFDMDILQLEWLCIDTINTEKEKENTLKWFILTSIRWCTVSFQVENTFFQKVRKVSHLISSI